MKSCKRETLAVVIALLLAASVNCVDEHQVKNAGQGAGPVLIEFEICQDLDLIKYSLFGEPPQFAIWLEDAASLSIYIVMKKFTSAF